jgi:hypothetical protein
LHVHLDDRSRSVAAVAQARKSKEKRPRGRIAKHTHRLDRLMCPALAALEEMTERDLDTLDCHGVAYVLRFDKRQRQSNLRARHRQVMFMPL